MNTPPPIALQSAARIIARTATVFRVSVEEITGPGRQRPIVYARQAACWVLRRSPWLLQTSGHHSTHKGSGSGAARFGPPAPVLRSFNRIGELLGGKDHSSVLYHVAQAEARRITDPEWRAMLDALLADRAPPAVKFLAPARPAKPAARQIRHRNDFTLAAGDDPYLADTDAAKRHRGSIALAEALAAYQAGGQSRTKPKEYPHETPHEIHQSNLKIYRVDDSAGVMGSG